MRMPAPLGAGSNRAAAARCASQSAYSMRVFSGARPAPFQTISRAMSQLARLQIRVLSGRRYAGQTKHARRRSPVGSPNAPARAERARQVAFRAMPRARAWAVRLQTLAASECRYAGQTRRAPRRSPVPPPNAPAQLAAPRPAQALQAWLIADFVVVAPRQRACDRSRPERPVEPAAWVLPGAANARQTTRAQVGVVELARHQARTHGTARRTLAAQNASPAARQAAHREPRTYQAAVHQATAPVQNAPMSGRSRRAEIPAHAR